MNKTSLLALSVLLGSIVCLPAQTPAAASNTAVEPVPRNDWMVKHDSYVDQAKKGGIDVLFLGDSITERWNTSGKQVWAEQFAPLKAANFGIGGDRTENVLWRVQNGELEGIKPKAVVLLIGTNNLGKNKPAEIAEGITAIVKELRQRLPESKILLQGVFPRGEKANPSREQIKEINKTISALADGQQVTFIDFGDKLLQPDGSIAKEMMADLLHIGEPGYKIWAESIKEPLSAILKPQS